MGNCYAEPTKKDKKNNRKNGLRRQKIINKKRDVLTYKGINTPCYCSRVGIYDCPSEVLCKNKCVSCKYPRKSGKQCYNTYCFYNLNRKKRKEILKRGVHGPDTQITALVLQVYGKTAEQTEQTDLSTVYEVSITHYDDGL
jgi:transposase-like protein